LLVVIKSKLFNSYALLADLDAVSPLKNSYPPNFVIMQHAAKVVSYYESRKHSIIPYNITDTFPRTKKTLNNMFDLPDPITDGRKGAVNKVIWQNPQYESPARFAVVLAFAPLQLHSVLLLMSYWTSKFSPCDVLEKSDKNYPISLVLSFDNQVEDPTNVLALSHFTSFISNNPAFLQCFRDLRAVSLGVPSNLGRLEGAASTFFSMVARLGGLGYTAFFVNEPDVLPIRANWLSGLFTEFKRVHCGIDGLWQLGSASMCDVRYGEIQTRMDLHINGNSMYALNCPGFLAFLENVKKTYPIGSSCKTVPGCATGRMYEDGYDHTMYQFRERIDSFEYTRWILPRFAYSHFILNLCEDRYNGTELAVVHDDVLLVHSKYFRFSEEELVLRDIYVEHAGRLPTMQERQKHYVRLKSKELEPYTLRVIVCQQTSQKTELECITEINDKDSTILAKLESSKYLGVPGANHVLYQRESLNGITPASISLAKIAPIPQNVLTKLPLWKDRYPGELYAWSVDLHASPTSCNIPILREIGVVLHTEVDFPNCIYFGVCRTERLKSFGYHNMKGEPWAGFSLDNPNPKEQKHNFALAYKDDDEMRRVDFVICSHPSANCELFVALNKPMIIYPTTRLEFGRADTGIDWRLQHIHKYKDEKDEFHHSARWRQWVMTLKNLVASGQAIVAANNRYDIEYIRYHTGIKGYYLPSWCGNYDCSYGDPAKRYEWFGCSLDWRHMPLREEVLIGPYRMNLDRTRFELKTYKSEMDHPILQAMKKAVDNQPTGVKKPVKLAIMSEILTDISPDKLVFHPAIVIMPYQVSTMSLFEYYRLCIPLFAPSVELLSNWHREHGILWERIYGNPKRQVDLLSSEELMRTRGVPDPNSDTNESFRYWIKYADWYTWPHVTLFDSWEHLILLLQTVDLKHISNLMYQENQRLREELKFNWSKVIRDLAISSVKE
jgi:hypothetical protein